MNKAYQRINDGKGWKNFPSDETALNEYNLNHMEVGIDTIDGRVVSQDAKISDLDRVKLEKSDAYGFVNGAHLDQESGIFTFTTYGGREITVPTILSKIVTNWDFDEISQQIILTLEDGSVKHVDLSALIMQHEFLDSETVRFEVRDSDKEAFSVNWIGREMSFGVSGDIGGGTYKSMKIESDAEVVSISGQYEEQEGGGSHPIEFLPFPPDPRHIIFAEFPLGTKDFVMNVQTSENIESLSGKKISGYYWKKGSVSAYIQAGSIREEHLRPDYLSEIKAESESASENAKLAEESAYLANEKALESNSSALLAKSYSDGDTGIRVGESTDNSKYYSIQSKAHADTAHGYLGQVEQAGDAAVDKIRDALDMDAPNFLVDLSTGHLMYEGGRFVFNVNGNGHLEWGLAV